MAKVAGRKVLIKEDISGAMTLVAGARADSISINNEPMDVTDKGDDGWRTYLNDASVRSVDMTVNGFVDGGSLLDKSLGPTTALQSAFEIEIEGIGSAAGTFHFSSLEVTANHDAASEFSATIASSGPVVWTPVV